MLCDNFFHLAFNKAKSSEMKTILLRSNNHLALEY